MNGIRSKKELLKSINHRLPAYEIDKFSWKRLLLYSNGTHRLIFQRSLRQMMGSPASGIACLGKVKYWSIVASSLLMTANSASKRQFIWDQHHFLSELSEWKHRALVLSSLLTNSPTQPYCGCVCRSFYHIEADCLCVKPPLKRLSMDFLQGRSS